VPPGAAPQAHSECRAFGAEHIRRRGRQAGGYKVYESLPLAAVSSGVNAASFASNSTLSLPHFFLSCCHKNAGFRCASLGFQKRFLTFCCTGRRFCPAGTSWRYILLCPRSKNTTQNSGCLTRNGSSELRTGLALHGSDSVERVVLNALANPHTACASGD